MPNSRFWHCNGVTCISGRSESRHGGGREESTGEFQYTHQVLISYVDDIPTVVPETLIEIVLQHLNSIEPTYLREGEY